MNPRPRPRAELVITAGGWNWITDMAERPLHTHFGSTWDGVFKAVCPHGVMTDWNAFYRFPLCDCS